MTLEVDDALPRMLGDRYRLEARLGQGGMGVVYRALDVHMQRPVAVKLIKGMVDVEIDDAVAGRFLREAKNTARLRHEHIVEVYDLGHEGGELFFVMELLHGESLSARLKRDGRLPYARAAHVGAQICEALHVAHLAGIVHRDLKPANVMLVRRAGDDLYAKVLDFGVAKSMYADGETQLTRTGMLVGTVEYMAPEQIAARPVDARTDVYAFGALLYKALAGSAVFQVSGAPALIHNHLNRAPESLRARVPDAGIPKALDEVVLRCLAKAPSDRFASMRDVAAALRAAADDLGALPSFEFENADDDVGSWDKTRVAPPSFDDVTDIDETRTRVRPESVPRAPRPPGAFDRDKTTQIAPSMTPAHGPVVCGMCRAVNSPAARACAACGVSLAAADQHAIASRVRPAASRPTPLPPPSSTAATPTPSSVWGRVLARLLGRG